jgi:hypothetical protein
MKKASHRIRGRKLFFLVLRTVFATSRTFQVEAVDLNVFSILSLVALKEPINDTNQN